MDSKIKENVRDIVNGVLQGQYSEFSIVHISSNSIMKEVEEHDYNIVSNDEDGKAGFTAQQPGTFYLDFETKFNERMAGFISSIIYSITYYKHRYTDSQEFFGCAILEIKVTTGQIDELETIINEYFKVNDYRYPDVNIIKDNTGISVVFAPGFTDVGFTDFYQFDAALHKEHKLFVGTIEMYINKNISKL